MAKKNTAKNLRAVNNEQKGDPSWEIRIALQRLVTIKRFCRLLVLRTLPALRGEEAISIPTVVVVISLAAPAAWVIAPRLHARRWRLRAAERSPAIVRPRM